MDADEVKFDLTGGEETLMPDGLGARGEQIAAFKVKVACRIRPLIKRDLTGDYQIAITPDLNTNQIKIGDKKKFNFDKVFDIESAQIQVYNECTVQLIDSCFKGYNATIMAYGQTGSGKTYTMGNCMEAREEDKGITPRAIDEIFRRVEEQTDSSFIVRATYVEVYNEEIYDLFAPGDGQKFVRNKGHSVTLREEKDGSILLCGAREEKIDDKEQLYLLLEQGSQRRSVGSTMMNDESSRSHAIFTLILEKSSMADEKDFVSSRFSFVDLAGSERLGRTEAVGKSMKEGININKGLLALGNVISALTDDTGKLSFIPYRVSKLTRILRNSLGGNSRTWMVACVSPVLADLDESLNTIKYATRARKISNTPIINKDPQSAIIAQLKQQVFKLSLDCTRMKKIIHSNGLTSTLQAQEDDDEASNVPGSPAAGKTLSTTERRLGRADTNLGDEAHPELEARVKTAERESMKMKEERNRLKKELNEKNVLYCKLIGRVNDLKIQNQKLIATFQFMTSNADVSMDMGADVSKNAIEIAQAVAAASKVNEMSETEVSMLLKEVDSLKTKLTERSKYASTLEEEYAKLLKISTRENELLVAKIKECSQVEAQLRQMKLNASKPQSDLHSSAIFSVAGNSGVQLSEKGDEGSFAGEASTTIADTTIAIDEEDQRKYEDEKMAREEEMRQLQASLEEKEIYLKQMMEREQEETEMTALTADEVVNLDKLSELEQQLMDAKRERDEAIKSLQDYNTLPLHRASTEVDSKTHRFGGRKASDVIKDPKEDVGKYKSKVSTLEQEIQDMRKKDKEVKEMDHKMQEKNSRIEQLRTEIQKMRMQRLDLDKKLREGSQSYAKTKLEKQKEIVNMKKELFKKTTEVTKLKNLTRKQDLTYHKKLAEIKRGAAKLKFTKKSVKKVNASTFENIDLDGFSQLIELFCQKVMDYAEIEQEVNSQTQVLLKYHTKLDELLTEISKLEAEKQTNGNPEGDLDDELVMIEAKQKEFETNISSCEEAIKIKRHFIDRLETQLDDTRNFLNEGFASLLTFLTESTIEKEVFWETALNIMMLQLEIMKKSSLEKDSKIKEVEATASEQLKNFGEVKRTNAKLEAEIEKLRKNIEEKDSEICVVRDQRDEAQTLHKSSKVEENISDLVNNAKVPAIRRSEKPDNRERGNSGVRKLDLDGLRNKLVNAEIQKEGAMKMAETLREKYIRMQDILSTMMEGTKPQNSDRNLMMPPEPLKVSRVDRFIKTHKRYGIGNMTVKHSAGAGSNAMNNSVNLEEMSPLNLSTSKRAKMNLTEAPAQSREPSAPRKIVKTVSQIGVKTAAAATRFSGVNLDLNQIEADISLYSKDLQYK